MFLIKALRILRRGVKTFRPDQRGNIAIVTALSMVALLGFASLAVDYGAAQMARTKLDSAADAASLKAVRTAVDVMSSGSGDWNAARAAADDAARTAFKANAGSLYGVVTPTPTISVTSSGGVVSADVVWSANATVALGGPLGWDKIKISGLSKAGAGLPIYYQFLFVVDVSQSMGIGGTAADMAALINHPVIACAFACHDPGHERYKIPDSWKDPLPIDRRSMARSLGIKLKMDFVSDAIQAFLGKVAAANAASGFPDLYKVGIHTIGSDFYVNTPPTTNITAVTAAAAALDIETAKPHSASYSFGYSYLNDGLNSSAALISSTGDGSSPSARKTFVVFLTDGVQDYKISTGTFRKTDTAYLSGCNAIKAKNVKMITIAAPIPTFFGDTYQSDLYIAPIQTQIAPTLQNCSSDASKYFFQATDGPGIVDAVSNLLSAAPQRLILTQ